jgi:hypothetical protein
LVLCPPPWRSGGSTAELLLRGRCVLRCAAGYTCSILRTALAVQKLRFLVHHQSWCRGYITRPFTCFRSGRCALGSANGNLGPRAGWRCDHALPRPQCQSHWACQPPPPLQSRRGSCTPCCGLTSSREVMQWTTTRNQNTPNEDRELAPTALVLAEGTRHMPPRHRREPTGTGGGDQSTVSVEDSELPSVSLAVNVTSIAQRCFVLSSSRPSAINEATACSRVKASAASAGVREGGPRRSPAAGTIDTVAAASCSQVT